ncbi:ETT1 [[Candida] subhashii]|uniref:Enhancer of translation termination 1 n=1 Tax=[Candida] subhashii TaxID=561895 RepID=A0A8J5QGI0_9ASCO|nr:ETT1 [[Candida] subhashii]KAG7665324.1 ETT1 [[Candida] subhashii]
MAKRPLGLGKAAKAKKQKKSSTDPSTTTTSTIDEQPEASNELTVELSEEVDPNDEFAQLKALHATYAKSDKDNQLVLNGIIHECDRLLRNTKEDISKIPDYFHAIYAISLSELARFHTDEIDKVKEFFGAGLERVELGLEKYKDSIALAFAKARILLNRLPLEFVSQLEVDSTGEGLDKLLDEALDVYEQGEQKADELKEYDLFNEDNLDFLSALDDFLDIVDNFGKDIMEGEDDDDEDDEEDEVELSPEHPLYNIRNEDKYNQWWRDHTETYLKNIDKQTKKEEVEVLRREVCKRLGQSYLQEAEIPSSVFTTLTYDEGFQDEEELHGLTKDEAGKISKELISKALEYLKQAEDKEEPQSWVDIAEAMISLGNLYELDSEEQENLYTEAEKILNKANNITNGKYTDVLENLLQ